MVFDVSVDSKFQHRVGTFLFSFAHTSATLGLELRTWNLLSENLDAALGGAIAVVLSDLNKRQRKFLDTTINY